MSKTENVKLAILPLVSIRKNAVMLRDVNRDEEEYKLLRDSVQQYGILDSISVTYDRDHNKEIIPDKYILINGLQRYSACEDLGIADIPCVIREKEDLDILAGQIIANAQRVNTPDAAFARAMKEFILMNPQMTKKELCQTLNKSEAWVDARLALTKLARPIQDAVDVGAIILSNAIALSNIPEKIRLDYVDRAKTMLTSDFALLAQQARTEYRKALNTGRDPNEKVFRPIPKIRKQVEVQDEINNPQVIRALLNDGNVVSPLEAAIVALTWALNMDKLSVEQQREAYNAHEAKVKADREKLAAERAIKKGDEARSKLSALTVG